jgi:hypothetical protein
LIREVKRGLDLRRFERFEKRGLDLRGWRGGAARCKGMLGLKV